MIGGGFGPQVGRFEDGLDEGGEGKEGELQKLEAKAHIKGRLWALL